MNSRLEEQIRFIVEVDKAKEILRRTIKTTSKKAENDAEHSWHLALMAPILREYVNEDINIERVMNMVIIHDLVEIDAGDTFCYDEKGNKDKKERELRAAKRIFSILPQDQGEIIFQLWNEFEEMKTPEAKYAAALDRLQPLLLNISTGGSSWKENKTTKTMVLERMAIIKEVSEELWDIVIKAVNKGIEQGALINS